MVSHGRMIYTGPRQGRQNPKNSTRYASSTATRNSAQESLGRVNMPRVIESSSIPGHSLGTPTVSL